MPSENKKRDQVLTTLIIVISVSGILYFGYQSIRETNRNIQDNPFAYNIEYFKQSDSALFHYEQIGELNLELDLPLGITIGMDNTLHVSGDRLILKLAHNGSILNTIECSASVRALCMDTQGNLYAAQNRHIEVYNTAGKRKTRWDISGKNPLITSIAVSTSGVYVADAGAKTVWHFNLQGELKHKIGPEKEAAGIPALVIPSPYFDVAVDPDGFIWIANTGNHALESYTPDGTFRSSWGSYSMKTEGFSGCCNPSHFAILSDGSFVTSEKGIPRVKVYNRAGILVSLVAGPERFLEGTVGLDLSVDANDRIYILDPKKKAVRIFDKKEVIQSKETS